MSEAAPGSDTEHASGVPTDVLTVVLENVRADPHLIPEERQFSLHSTASESRLKVDVEIPALTRRLLLHPRFEVETLRVSDEASDGRFGAVVDPSEYEGEGYVTGVTGTLPAGALTVAATGRKSNAWRRIVSDTVLDNDPRGDDGD